ncbi:MAG: TetR family transcriptional regulator [Polyangiaceae bacterium]|nr:TetR family transcriptional regulator [Polyangiaceae bacterium]
MTARRTQKERRDATRAALLEATITSLVEVGYTGTTTTEIVRRAGVSQGALFKHFPTKAALVAAATERLFAGLFVDFERAFERASRDEAPIVAAVRGLWRVFCTRPLLAVYRLYAEAPSDPELRRVLRPVVARHEAHLARFARELFPAIAASPEHRALFEGIVFAMQGLSLQRAVHVPQRTERELLRGIERLAARLAAGAGA